MEVWERIVSGNLNKYPKWGNKKEKERRLRTKEFVPWLRSGGENSQSILMFYVYVLRARYVFAIFHLLHVQYITLYRRFYRTSGTPIDYVSFRPFLNSACLSP